MNHVLKGAQFANPKLIGDLFSRAKELEAADLLNKVPKLLAGKIVATIFYETSTRTRLSFEAAALKLGAGTISVADPKTSSASKGESLEDSIKVISGYADILVLRHPENGAAEKAAGVSSVPVVNAGDGSNEHPTQALLDVYTMQKELGDLAGKTIVFIGDHRNGRALHSMLPLLALYKMKIILVSPAELKLPEEYKSEISKAGLEFEEMTEPDNALGVADVLYVGRIMKERFTNEEEYNKLKDSYTVNKAMLSKMKENSIVMAALPRVGDIDPEIDSDPRAAYFREAKNGLYVRMALLLWALGL